MDSFESMVLSRICEYMRMEIASSRNGEIHAKETYNAKLCGLIEGLMLVLSNSYVMDLVSTARRTVNKEMRVSNESE